MTKEEKVSGTCKCSTGCLEAPKATDAAKRARLLLSKGTHQPYDIAADVLLRHDLCAKAAMHIVDFAHETKNNKS